MGAVGGQAGEPPPPGTLRGEPGLGRASQDGLAVPGPTQGTPQPDQFPPGQVVSQMPCRVPSPGLLLLGSGSPSVGPGL